MITPLKTAFSADALQLDPERETQRIIAEIRRQVTGPLRRKGAVLGLSGGIDSTVTAALCARALGPDRMLGLFMPERDSSGESLTLGQAVGDWLGIPTRIENIASTLEAAGCYSRRDEAIRRVFPEYGPGWRSKIALPGLSEDNPYRLFRLIVETPEGATRQARLPLEAYQEIVAATNFKQRVRKMLEYFHADRLRYAVAGTPNRLEAELGFFVKNGDGSADFKPIAHLYKTQVYQLADYLGAPAEIRMRPPTTDTYSLAQSQEEFFFSLPYREMDLCLYGRSQGVPCEAVADAAGLRPEQVERAYRDIDAKHRAAEYLHAAPLLIAH